ncbi:WD repeat-containing protein 19 [Exaiptasia diaphana]|nr:WD repeat-containing protein 19 [Exaiptasia diaphana]
MKRVFSIPEKVTNGTGVGYCWQKSQGSYLAVSGFCTGMGWDKDGDTLAIIQDKSGIIFLWDSNSLKLTQLESGLRKIPILGKHTKKIICGCWNQENLLALGAEDKSITVSNVDGDTVRQATLRNDPADIRFSEMKTDERSSAAETTHEGKMSECANLDHNAMQTAISEKLSMIVGKKTLYLYNLNDPDNPIELAFQARYGGIISYRW